MKTPEETESENSRKMHGRKRRASMNTLEWPKSSDGFVYVPYDTPDWGRYSMNKSHRENLTQAINDFGNKTCIRIIPRTKEVNYIQIIDDGGCYSNVGMIGGAQRLSLGDGCGVTGIILHEFMHALGFWHEQSRRDRDEHVTIYWDKIHDSLKKQYTMDRYGLSFVMGEDYDLQSVLHYGNYAGAKTRGEVTMIAKKDPTIRMGQRITFSEQDIREINLKHRCGPEYVTFSPAAKKPATKTGNV